MRRRPADILFVTRKWPPAIGGMETYCVRLTEELARNWYLDLIALPGRPDGRAPHWLGMLWFAITAPVRILARPPARIVHIGDLAAWPLGWLASLRRSDQRIIISAHGSDLSLAIRGSPLAKLYGTYVRLGARLLPRATVIANSNWIAGLARSVGFRSVKTIPLGTDFRPPAPPVMHNGSLLFVGRIKQSKGLSFLLRDVLARLSQPPSVRVAGAVWEAAEAELLDHPLVDYLGPLGAEDLAREYQAALCTVVPSQQVEGFGLVAIEAAACGSPVIASNHSGLAEVVTPAIGQLVDRDDPEGWARAIERVQNWTAEERSRHAAAAMSAVRERYSWATVARQTAIAYGFETQEI